jgi:hypothetical protein
LTTLTWGIFQLYKAKNTTIIITIMGYLKIRWVNLGGIHSLSSLPTQIISINKLWIGKELLLWMYKINNKFRPTCINILLYIIKSMVSNNHNHSTLLIVIILVDYHPPNSIEVLSQVNLYKLCTLIRITLTLHHSFKDPQT